MPSPFPGMDPYLEDPAFWSDFHDSFIVYWRDALNGVLPGHYEARVNERTRLVDLSSDEAPTLRPDGAIHRAGSPLAAPDFARGAVVATPDPVTIPLQYLEEVRETYLEIRRRPERDVVATLELLSPSNKAGADRQSYLEKREDLLRRDVHLVELDLLRGGHRIPLRRDPPIGDYFYFVSRGDRRPNCEVYAWGVRDRLPGLPEPLRAPDADVRFDLAALVGEAYDKGRYARSLAYSGPPPGPWPDEDRAWIEDGAKRAGR